MQPEILKKKEIECQEESDDDAIFGLFWIYHASVRRKETQNLVVENISSILFKALIPCVKMQQTKLYTKANHTQSLSRKTNDIVLYKGFEKSFRRKASLTRMNITYISVRTPEFCFCDHWGFQLIKR